MRARNAGLPGTLLFATVLLLLAPSAGGPADRPSFTVAVLRRDGILIPFATFDGNRWSNRWPARQATEVPIGLGDVPREWWPNKEVTRDWTAWLVAGKSQPIKVQAPALVSVHCNRRVGLRTDFVSLEPPPPPDFQPYPKNGLAIAGQATVERVELVQPASAEAKAFVELIADSVNEAETRAARAWAGVWVHPVDQKGRAKTPLALEVLARAPGVDPASAASYFEGVKKYPGFLLPSEPDPFGKGKDATPELCDYVTFTGGWVLSTPGGGAPRKLIGADMTNCNRQGVAYTLPLGVIRTAGRVFWIVQASGWDFERYDVIEVRAKDIKTVLSVGGGGCQ
jgi:hypothetical protein